MPPEARKALFGSIRSGLNELNISKTTQNSIPGKKRYMMPKFRDVLNDVMKLQQSDMVSGQEDKRAIIGSPTADITN